MGENETAGYLAIGIMAFLTASIASDYGLYPYPFYIGFVTLVAGIQIVFRMK